MYGAFVKRNMFELGEKIEFVEAYLS